MESGSSFKFGIQLDKNDSALSPLVQLDFISPKLAASVLFFSKKSLIYCDISL